MHFEDIWNSAEAVSKTLDTASAVAFSNIENNIKKLQELNLNNEEKTIIFGDIMFNLCIISREYNINSAAALASAVRDARSEIEDP